MTDAEVMCELQARGTEQNRKVYRRHGVGENQFGVSYADLGKLKKNIKVDHELALKLWATGNHDARVLATMIADPKQMTTATAEAWVKSLENYVLTDAIAGLVSQAPPARKLMEKWTTAKGEWVGRTGWLLLGKLAMNDDDMPDDSFAGYLATIESGIHSARNRVRDAMLMALIGIAARNTGLKAKALASAARIGKVEVDHGETGCKTPDAAVYIEKIYQRRRQK